MQNVQTKQGARHMEHVIKAVGAEGAAKGEHNEGSRGSLDKTYCAARSEGRAQRESAVASVVLALVSAVLLWQLLVMVTGYPDFILPSPARVWAKLVVVVGDGTLRRHADITISEILMGLVLGVSVALPVGYVLAKSPTLERVLSPYIIASQSVPVVAIAPLIFIWFGAGLLPKTLICALMVFFPMLVNTIVGIRSVDPDLRELMHSLRATRLQVFRMLELPSALPILLGGLRLGVTMAVIGSVVGEFVGADRGLGFLINLARGVFDTPLMFVAIFAVVAIAMALYLAVLLAETRLLAWRR